VGLFTIDAEFGDMAKDWYQKTIVGKWHRVGKKH
jgi:hypothetical protein